MQYSHFCQLLSDLIDVLVVSGIRLSGAPLTKYRYVFQPFNKILAPKNAPSTTTARLNYYDFEYGVIHITVSTFTFHYFELIHQGHCDYNLQILPLILLFFNFFLQN